MALSLTVLTLILSSVIAYFGGKKDIFAFKKEFFARAFLHNDIFLKYSACAANLANMRGLSHNMTSPSFLHKKISHGRALFVVLSLSCSSHIVKMNGFRPCVVILRLPTARNLFFRPIL